jgi:hypothetical protein
VLVAATDGEDATINDAAARAIERTTRTTVVDLLSIYLDAFASQSLTTFQQM